MVLPNGRRTVEVAPGVGLCCDVRGAARGSGGAPLVLLPAVGGGSELWGEFRDLVGCERATLAIDPRGFGRSSREPAWPTTRSMARDVARALDRLGVDRVAVFGISLGALVASWLAVELGRRVERLILASAAARGLDFSPRRLSRAFRLTRSAVLSDEPKPELAEDVLAEDAPLDVKAQARAGAARHPWSRSRLLRFLGAVARHAPGPELQRIAAAVLLVWGERDPIIGSAARRRLCERLSGAEVVVLRGAGHDLVLEAPAELAARTLRFLDRPQ